MFDQKQGNGRPCFVQSTPKQGILYGYASAKRKASQSTESTA